MTLKVGGGGGMQATSAFGFRVYILHTNNIVFCKIGGHGTRPPFFAAPVLFRIFWKNS